MGSLPPTLWEAGSTLVNNSIHDTGASSQSQKQVWSAGLPGIKGIQQLGVWDQKKNDKRHEIVTIITQSIPNWDHDS